MTKKQQRVYIHNKFGGRCGYCGRVITIKEMQVDHMHPLGLSGNGLYGPEQLSINDISNLTPACRKCNHYKRCDTVHGFRQTMITLHRRLEKIYIVNVAANFGMLEIKPFDGLFYFEKIKP